MAESYSVKTRKTGPIELTTVIDAHHSRAGARAGV